MSQQIGRLTILASRDWDGFISTLRTVSIHGDPQVNPYKDARVSSKIIRPHDVMPLSLYALKSKLEYQTELHRILMRDHGIDTFDQDGDKPEITFRIAGEKGVWNMAPPIVEVSAVDGNQPVLIDGEHRFLSAVNSGRQVRVVWIENIPAVYPTVARPVPWSDVKVLNRVPAISRKRRFRFMTLRDFPDISEFSAVKVNDDSYRYFFYRNLNPVSTGGIRGQGEI